MTRSPGFNLSNRPHLSVRYFSTDFLPPHAFDRNQIDPCGVIPMRTFTVLWSLQWEKIWALASRLDERSMKISKQSIMIVVLVPKEYWKHIGIVRQNSSCSGQVINGESLTSRTIIQDEIILETVGKDTSNLKASSCIGTFSLSFTITITISQKEVSVFYFLVACEEKKIDNVFQNIKSWQSSVKSYVIISNQIRQSVHPFLSFRKFQFVFFFILHIWVFHGDGTDTLYCLDSFEDVVECITIYESKTLSGFIVWRTDQDFGSKGEIILPFLVSMGFIWPKSPHNNSKGLTDHSWIVR